VENKKKNFSIPIVRENEELARPGGISLENSILSSTDLPLEKFPTHETVVCLGKNFSKPKDYIQIGIDAEDYYRIKESEKKSG